MRFLLIITLVLAPFFTDIKATERYNPKNLIIATDLDDVVLERRKGAIAAKVFKNFFRIGSLYAEFRKNRKPGDSVGQRYGEGFYLYLIDKGEHKLAKIVRSVNTKKRLKKNTVKIMQKMAAQGYEIYTATNIGSVFFAKLQKKFADVFNDRCIRQGMTVDFTKTKVIQKPNPKILLINYQPASLK